MYIHCNTCTWYHWCRQSSKADATNNNTASDKVKAADDKIKEETLSSHIYEKENNWNTRQNNHIAI